MGKKGQTKDPLITKLPLIISFCTALLSFTLLTIYPLWTKYVENTKIVKELNVEIETQDCSICKFHYNNKLNSCNCSATSNEINKKKTMK